MFLTEMDILQIESADYQNNDNYLQVYFLSLNNQFLKKVCIVITFLAEGPCFPQRTITLIARYYGDAGGPIGTVVYGGVTWVALVGAQGTEPSITAQATGKEII